MRRPRILITSSLGRVGKKKRLSAITGMGYIGSVEDAGGIPLILAPLNTDDLLKDIITGIDGVICTGGPDYRRGGEHPHCTYVHPRREEHDFRIISSLLHGDFPVLGICLGMQLMNICAGGDIHRHLPDSTDNSVDHANSNHTVTLTSGSRMRSVLGDVFMVNSSHHQAIRIPGNGFEESAHAPDGVIEMIECLGTVFRLGVQWHPERMSDSPVQKKLFSSFMWSARNGGKWP